MNEAAYFGSIPEHRGGGAAESFLRIYIVSHPGSPHQSDFFNWTHNTLCKDSTNLPLGRGLAGNNGYTAYCLHRLLKISKGTDLYRRLLEQIDRMGPQAATALPAALSDRDQGIRRMTMIALGQLGMRAKSAVSALAEALKDEDERVRSSAADALGRIGGESVLALEKLLKDKDERVRSYAAQALGQVGTAAQPAVPALIEALKDNYEWVRSPAIDALGQIGEEAIPALVEALKDKDERVCSSVAQALGRVGWEAVNAHLAKLAKSLTSGSSETRAATARELGIIIPLLRKHDQKHILSKSIDGIVILLSEVARDVNEESKVRSSAEKALANITGPSGRSQGVFTPKY
jgi:HEAT repeat protein